MISNVGSLIVLNSQQRLPMLVFSAMRTIIFKQATDFVMKTVKLLKEKIFRMTIKA